MALPTSINNATPLGSASPATIDDQFRDLKLFLTDLFGVPNATNISANVMTVVAGGLDSINFANSGANAAVAGELQRNGANLTFHDGTSARTTVWAETTQTVSGNKTFSAGVWNGTAVGSQYGGTGQNTSANTGVPSISSGTWSVSSTLSPTLGGTGQNTSASTGVPSVSSGTWSVASTLSTTLGGTGQNFSATAQGNTLYFSSAGTVAALSPGTSGYFLKTQGAGANPVWADATPADGSITTAKISDSNVTTAKLADSGVTTAKLADSNVTTAKLADSGVTTAKIADVAVTVAKLATTGRFALVRFDRDMTTAAGTTTHAHGGSVTPVLIIAIAHIEGSGEFSVGLAVPATGVNECSRKRGDQLTYTRQVNALYLAADGATYQNANISGDATNLIFTWIKGGSPTGTGKILCAVFF